MKKIILFMYLCALTGTMSAQLHMRDVFAQLPDSILPLLTKNNRLDCIDFIENNMEARVKNRFDDQVVLETLTEDYFSIRVSEGCVVEMKLVPGNRDTLICVNRTYHGPVEDSEVRVYDRNWQFLRIVQRPDIHAFVQPVGFIQPWTSERADTLSMIRSEACFLPLIRASLSAEHAQIVWTLQTKEFSKEIKKVAEKYLQSVKNDI